MTAIPYPAIRHNAALWRMFRRFLKFVVLFAVAAVLVVCFERGHYLPVRVSVFLILMLALAGLLACRFAPASPLTRLMIALYAVPFGACVGYLFRDDYLWWDTPLAIWYMSDPVTTQIMTMVGLIGLYGLLVGYSLSAGRRPVAARAFRLSRTLKPAPFLIATAAALFFSFISTPSETIFSSLYTAANGIAGSINFNASNLVAYTLLMMLVIDAEQERTRPLMQNAKRGIVLITTAYILIFFQILRGDRDSFGYLVGLAAIFITEPLRGEHAPRIRRRRLTVLAIFGLLLVTVFLMLGEIRLRLAVHQDFTIREALASGLTRQSTATAVLLTNLSQAHAMRMHDMPPEYGRTYVDYLLSLPPGFITRALDIERPVENNRGPNFWFTDISAGGVHVVTVPFRNFLAPGAFLFLVLYGYLIARSEILGMNPRWLSRLWYASMFVCAAQWFWYGDIVFIREVMIFALTALTYSIVRRIGAFSLTTPEPAR